MRTIFNTGKIHRHKRGAKKTLRFDVHVKGRVRGRHIPTTFDALCVLNSVFRLSWPIEKRDAFRQRRQYRRGGARVTRGRSRSFGRAIVFSIPSPPSFSNGCGAHVPFVLSHLFLFFVNARFFVASELLPEIQQVYVFT